ncbi:glycosyltransferase family 2 protein [Paenibacillus albidus]|uniref:glycosyltransferase family 2 protein n=1 Tax=Paenibacillus albidus TaxID=2041023 RepID=UPI001BE87E8D|nr:glycosyltransferase family 2 protein [Paenibacillus albidus]MBT2290573.1 glycosyltransferase family 2 protein [Paenibacillus albidus]
MNISIVIVNYNTKEMTSRCVDSFLHNRVDDKDIEIIVVDNASTDGSSVYFQEKYSYRENIKIILNEKNFGFGLANNIGVGVARGHYIAFANSDTYVDGFDFGNLIKCFEEHGNLGALSCKILYPNGSIQTLGFDFPSLLNDFKLNVLFWNYKFVKKIRYRNYHNKGLIKRDWVSGCFFMCKKELFQKVNGFDSEIFMYAEDLDICARFYSLGLENFVYDKEEIYHLHGQSSINSKISFKKMLVSKKNYYYVMRKNKLVIWPQLIYLIHLIHLVGLFLLKRFKQISSK